MMKNRVAKLIINHHGHKATNKFVVQIFGQKLITAYTTNAESAQRIFAENFYLIKSSISPINLSSF